MNKKLLSLVIMVAFACVPLAYSAPQLVGGSPMVVNNTTSNCVVTAAFQANPTLQTFSVQHGALTSTNNITIVVSNTLDQVHYTYGYTWHPSNTNATTEYIYSGSVPVTNYCRASVTTTNSQSVIINYGQ